LFEIAPSNLARGPDDRQLLLRPDGAPVGLRKRTGQSALFAKGTRRPRLCGALFHSGGFDLRNGSARCFAERDHKGFMADLLASTLSGFLVGLGKVVQGLLLGHEASPLVCHTSAGCPPI